MDFKKYIIEAELKPTSDEINWWNKQSAETQQNYLKKWSNNSRYKQLVQKNLLKLKTQSKDKKPPKDIKPDKERQKEIKEKEKEEKEIRKQMEEISKKSWEEISGESEKYKKELRKKAFAIVQGYKDFKNDKKTKSKLVKKLAKPKEVTEEDVNKSLDDVINGVTKGLVKDIKFNKREKTEYENFAKAMKKALKETNPKKRKQMLFDIKNKYGIKKNPRGQLYVTSAIDKSDKTGSGENAKRGISARNSRPIDKIFLKNGISIVAGETKEPYQVLSETAKPDLGNHNIAYSKDESVKNIFAEEPFKDLNEKYQSVYGPLDKDKKLLENINGRHAKEYLEQSIKDNSALDKTIKQAEELVDAGKISDVVVKSLKAHKERMNKIVNEMKRPDEKIAKAIGDSYAKLAAELHENDKKIAIGVMKQFAEMNLYQTEIAIGKEVYLPSAGNFPSGDKLKITRRGTKCERVSGVSVKTGRKGGIFGLYGFPGQTDQYQKFHKDKEKRNYLSSNVGGKGYSLGIRDDLITDGKKFNDLLNGSEFKGAFKPGFQKFLIEYKKRTDEAVKKHKGSVRLAEKDLNKLDKEYAEKMMKYTSEDNLTKILGSDNAKLIMNSGPNALMSAVTFSHILKTGDGLPVIEHNHQYFENNEWHDKTEDSTTGTIHIKNWKMIWRPRGKRSQGIAASYNSERIKLDTPAGEKLKEQYKNAEDIEDYEDGGEEEKKKESSLTKALKTKGKSKTKKKQNSEKLYNILNKQILTEEKTENLKLRKFFGF